MRLDITQRRTKDTPGGPVTISSCEHRLIGMHMTRLGITRFLEVLRKDEREAQRDYGVKPADLRAMKADWFAHTATCTACSTQLQEYQRV